MANSPTTPVILRKPSGAHLGEKLVGAEDDEKDIDLGSSMSSMPSFEIFPEYLRVGPWSVFAYLYLICFGAYLAYGASEALGTYGSTVVNPVSQAFDEQTVWMIRCGLAVYLTGVLVWAMRNFGMMPMVSYTMCGYLLLTLRFQLTALGFHHAAEAVRFPSLVMAWVTTTVWWLILVPIMYVAIPGGDKARRKFIQFNFSWFLLNVHLFNLPLAMLDHMLSWRSLCFFDLWVGMVVAFCYVWFYLLVLDANGWHFYIILSPRKWWCVGSYSLVTAIYVAIYTAFG
eukprot:TRINITY_DN9798_c0_g1_i1.p1 TRINITY_DN9798_c0_g1~~TRINITY_DN9798_c0_g1_i1.p1  ORF type:complete len:285 (-),score=42.41 TRINITY_DN9798_c0_g1_i1:332-1186(-)